jgi:hypothetical protein
MDINKVIDGDGTVVEPSAHYANDATSTRYWVNLGEYNKDHKVQMAFGWAPYDHTFFFDVPQVRALLGNIVKDGILASLPPLYVSPVQPDYSGNGSRLHFTLHSPLTLGFTDSQGNYTGATATTSVFNIPGVDYERFGEVQWLSVPADLAGHVVMHGTGSGSFALDVEEQTGDTITATTTFAAIPVSTSTVATFAITPSSSPTMNGQLVADYAGNGSQTTTYKAQEGNIVLPDITPPTTVATTTGTKGTNGWYTSSVVVTLSATDTQSSVATTTYSLNGGTTWTATTTNPTILTITKEGTTTISYHSIDAMGNQEATSTLSIKIDKTPPEATIGLSTTTKKILTTGSDNLSPTAISTTSSSTIITDQAGYRLIFSVSQNLVLPNYAALIMPSFSYDTGSTTTATTSLRYFWLTDKNNKYTLFVSAIRTPTDRLVSLYIPATNKTYILQSLSTDDTDDLSKMTIQLLLRKILKQVSGMVVPYITTSSGSVRVGY